MNRGIKAGACALPAIFILSLGVLSFAADYSHAPDVPAGLPPLVWPANNPYTSEKAELGRYLYFDRRLSADATVSCATCHGCEVQESSGVETVSSRIVPSLVTCMR